MASPPVGQPAEYGLFVVWALAPLSSGLRGLLGGLPDHGRGGPPWPTPNPAEGLACAFEQGVQLILCEVRREGVVQIGDEVLGLGTLQVLRQMR